MKDIVDDEDEEEGGPIGPIECEGNPPWAPGFGGSRRTGGAFLAPPAIFASRAAILRLTRSDSARSCVTVSAMRSVRGGGKTIKISIKLYGYNVWLSTDHVF